MLNEWFSKSITDKCTPAMLPLVSNIESIEPIKIKKKYGVEILKFVENERERLSKNEQEIRDLRYRIPIEYKLTLTKSPKDADIMLSKGDSDTLERLFIEVPKDIERTHPYLQKDIIAKFKEKVRSGEVFNQYDFQAILYKEKIKDNPRYYYEIKNPVIHRYSNSLVVFILRMIKKDSNYLKNARKQYKNREK